MTDIRLGIWRRKSDWAKHIKTGALCYSWISLGLYSEILGPTLPTLINQTDSNYEQVSIALSVRSAGLLCGSLLGGWLSDLFKSYRAIQIAIALVIAAITNLIIPWCVNIPSLAGTLYLAGCSHGMLTTNGNPLLASVWEQKASGPFSLMHSGYGLGAAVAPLLVEPFAIESNATMNQSHSDSYGGMNSTTVLLINAPIPYAIVASILFLCSIIFFIIHTNDYTNIKRKSLKNHIENTKQVKRAVLKSGEPKCCHKINKPMGSLILRISNIESSLNQ